MNNQASGIDRALRIASVIVIPLAVVWLGFLVENALGSKERLVEKRLEIYSKVGPLLNNIYVHVEHVGHWSEMNDKKAIEAKRESDKTMFSNQAFWSESLISTYRAYMNKAFKTYNAEGENAKPLKASRSHRRHYEKLMNGFNEEFQ